MQFGPYAGCTRTATRQSESLRAAIASHRRALKEILGRYGATNARLFGSVARGDATPESDIDLLVDLTPGGGNELLRVSAIAEELTELLGNRVDVVASSLLRGEVSASALADAVAVWGAEDERFADVLGAIERCLDYAPHLHSGTSWIISSPTWPPPYATADTGNVMWCRSRVDWRRTDASRRLVRSCEPAELS